MAIVSSAVITLNFTYLSCRKVWYRWHERQKSASVILDIEESDIEDFLDNALKKSNLGISATEVTIADFESFDSSDLVALLLNENSSRKPLVLYPLSLCSSSITEQQLKKISFKCSPSVFATPSKKSLQSKTKVSCKTYQHWFALEIYNSYNAIIENGDSFSVSLDGQTFQLDHNTVNTLVKEMLEPLNQWPSDTTPYMECSEIRNKEVTATAVICRLLDRFLFPDKDMKMGGCFHQLPTYAGSIIHSADLLVCSLNSGVPMDIVLASDYKISDEKVAYLKTIGHSVQKVAYLETIGHCVQSANMYPYQRVVLGLVVSGNNLKLLVCQNNGDKRLLAVEAIETNSASDIWRFLCVLYACVHYLLVSPVQIPRLHVSDIVVKCEDGSVEDHKCLSDRVVECVKSKRVHKYFDSKCHEHNYELIRELELLPNADLIPLSSDNRFHCLSYDYLEPKDVTHVVSPKDFEPLLLQLSKLHGKGLVHSDVRCANIILTNNGGHLIDFDLVEREGVKYPYLYNCDIPERAPGAISGFPRRKEHDRISIVKCMNVYVAYM